MMKKYKYATRMLSVFKIKEDPELQRIQTFKMH